MFRRLGYFLSPQLDIYKHVAPLVAGKRVLDVGFGTGFGALQLVPCARSVSGIEVDPGAIRFADSYMPGASWRWGDIQRPITHIFQAIDVVLMIEVLEHVIDWQAALRNVRDCLAPGGKLVISARNANADLRKNDLHEREWTAEELVKNISPFFESVVLYDYSLSEEQSLDTRITPIIAVCEAKKENDNG